MRTRRAFRRRAHRQPPARLVFIDEFGTNLGMARRYARAQGGERALGRAPVNADPHVTLTFAIALRGLFAPMALPGAQNGDSFEAYVRTQLAPRLRRGDVVIADGLGAHRRRVLRQLLRARGARYWILPPYSPDLNPIEEAGAKVKHLVRAEAPRTLEGLYAAMGRALRRVTHADLVGWFRHRATYAFGRMQSPR